MRHRRLHGERPESPKLRLVRRRVVTSADDGANRTFFGVADQVASSAVNFLLVICVARAGSQQQFGEFSLLMTGFLFAVSVFRSISAEPLMVVFPLGQRDAGMRSARAASGTAVSLAMLMGGVLAISSVGASGTMRSLLLIVGLALPGLIAQDVSRYVLINSRRSSSAFLNDAAYMCLQLAGFGLCAGIGRFHVDELTICWAGVGNVMAVVAIVQSGVVPGLLDARGWVVSQRAYAGRYLVEALAAQGGTQIVTYCVVGFAGVRASGAMRAAETLYKPVAVLTGGAKTALISELAARRDNPSHIVRQAAKLGVVLLALNVVLGLPIVFLPRRFGTMLLGASWDSARPLLLAVWIAQAGAVIAMSALIGLRALADARRSFRAQISAMTLQVIFGVFGAALDAAPGAVRGLAVASLIQACWWWISLRSSAAERLQQAGAIGETCSEDSPLALDASETTDLSVSPIFFLE